MTVDITKQVDLDKMMKGSVTFIDFWAPWCVPCKVISPLVEELSNQYADVNFAKVDVDENPDIAVKFEIHSLPTTAVFVDGEKKGAIVGAVQKKRLEEMLLAHYTPGVAVVSTAAISTEAVSVPKAKQKKKAKA
jgi:thioredoxin 1